MTGAVLLVGCGCVLLWLVGQAASLLTGNGLAAGPVTAGARALLADGDNPAAAWDSTMQDAPAYWWITAVAITVIVAATIIVVIKIGGQTRRRGLVAEMESPGMAEGRAIRSAVGSETAAAQRLGAAPRSCDPR